MEGNNFHTTMAKQSSAITQPVGLVARGRMACMATGHVGGGGGVGSVANKPSSVANKPSSTANPGEHLG